MTAPAPRQSPTWRDPGNCYLPRNEWWCRACQTHRAFAANGLCPGCADEWKRKGVQG